ncbi:DUF3558 domain-containing protein [Amycolatopsis pittospori]|uniref:DUF3558 domain-containing protein n=1 Tax=Amycolatopsis pittospori TaxID=2749434 RepID=UPI0015F01736|nr:DUF3558 domain-containing protein [Amycolatopsis pittospori]
MHNVLKSCVAAATLVFVSAALAACSGENPGTPSPTPGADSSSGASSAPANPNVPKVSTPLTVRDAFLTEPCTVVSQADLSALGYTDAGRPGGGASGSEGTNPSCGWSMSKQGKGNGLQVLIGTGNREKGTGGLAGFYQAKETGRMKFVAPGPEVDGYPTVFYGLSDERAEGNCTMAVGVADDLAIGTLAKSYQGEQDSCETAQKLASAVIKTLKGA